MQGLIGKRAVHILDCKFVRTSNNSTRIQHLYRNASSALLPTTFPASLKLSCASLLAISLIRYTGNFLTGFLSQPVTIFPTAAWQHNYKRQMTCRGWFLSVWHRSFQWNDLIIFGVLGTYIIYCTHVTRNDAWLNTTLAAFANFQQVSALFTPTSSACP